MISYSIIAEAIHFFTHSRQLPTNRLIYILFSVLCFFLLFFCCCCMPLLDVTGGPLGLFIIFPEPIFGPPFTASNCDIKRRTICWTPNTNRIHVQRWSKCTILSAFCSVKNSRIVEGEYRIIVVVVLTMNLQLHTGAHKQCVSVFLLSDYVIIVSLLL